MPYEFIDYDESMIKYFVRHGCKQFIRGKPIRFGFKVWCLNDDNGYLINFDFYQGKNSTSVEKYDRAFGKSAAPIIQMLDEMPDDVKGLPYSIFFDNLFKVYESLTSAERKGIQWNRNNKGNRIPKDCPLPSKKELLTKNRGESAHVLDKTDGIQIIKWMDNSVVAIASTLYGSHPKSNVNRFSQKQKKLFKFHSLWQ